MNPRAVAAVLTSMVVCPLVSASTCTGPSAKACDVSYQGLHVETGLVVDTVTPVCDVPPQRHTIKVQIETRVADTWIPQGRAAVTDAIPDQTGFPIPVSTECREGTYRTTVHVDGAGPTGTPFVFDDHGTEHSFALVECAG